MRTPCFWCLIPCMHAWCSCLSTTNSDTCAVDICGGCPCMQVGHLGSLELSAITLGRSVFHITGLSL